MSKTMYCRLCGREMLDSVTGNWYCICSKEATILADEAEAMGTSKRRRRRKSASKNIPKNSRKKA